jgi:hypothetical protein
MKLAVITYDLKNVKSGDNENVKDALLGFVNTYTGLKYIDWLSGGARIVNLLYPDTTITAELEGTSETTTNIAAEVVAVIQGVGAVPDKVYVAFIEEEFLWNATPVPNIG